MALSGILLLGLHFITYFMECHGGFNIDTCNTSKAYLKNALYGFDPFTSNPLEWPDLGFKGQIFEPYKFERDTRAISSFFDITRVYNHCDAQLSELTIKNYTQYREMKRNNFKFGRDAAAKVGNFSFESSYGYGVSSSKSEEETIHFFESGIGEIVVSQAECITYTVSLSPFLKPTFTEAFIQALRELNKAALGRVSDALGKETFISFIRNYGTHYMTTTHLGSKILFEKRFGSFSRNPKQERDRKNCVRKAAVEYIRRGIKLITSRESSFSTLLLNCLRSFESAENHDSSSTSDKVSSFGVFPSENLIEWSEVTKETPTPVRAELESISSLFKKEWLSTIPASSSPTLESLNASAIYNFFEVKLANYCKIMTGQDTCTYKEKGCGYNSDCPFNTKCIDENTEQLGYKCQQEKGCDHNSDCPRDTKCVNSDDSPLVYECQRAYGKIN